MSSRILPICCVALTILLVTAAMSPALAQSCTSTQVISVPVTDASAKIHQANWVGQTFTSPVSDCLVQVALEVCKSGAENGEGASVENLTVELRNAVAGSGGTVPDLNGAPLATANITPGSVTSCGAGNNQSPLAFSTVNAVFSVHAPLTNGSIYSLVFYQANGGGAGNRFYQLGVHKHPGSYTGGQFCKYSGSGWDCPQANGSLDTPLAVCTAACCTGCTYTQGYWKNHPALWPTSAMVLKLGTVSYSQANLLTILEAPVQGNGLIQLAHQLIAAKLNAATGACVPSAIATAIANADALIGNLVIPPVGTDSLPASDTSELTSVLDNYNSGCTQGGPPHCDAPQMCSAAH